MVLPAQGVIMHKQMRMQVVEQEKWGGYEMLPNPVPAADMVYDHVARGIYPNFAGFAESFPADMEAGMTYEGTFTVPIDENWNIDEVHLVGLLIDPSGDIDNAGSAALSEVSGVSEAELNQLNVSMYPNPAKN